MQRRPVVAEILRAKDTQLHMHAAEELTAYWRGETRKLMSGGCSHSSIHTRCSGMSVAVRHVARIAVVSIGEGFSWGPWELLLLLILRLLLHPKQECHRD